MRAKAAVLIGSLAASGACEACLWFHGNDLRGNRVTVEGRDPKPYVLALAHHEDRVYWEGRRQEIEGKLGAGVDPRLVSDHAAALVHLGELPKAIALLEDLEATKRGDYAAAANLGTAYELAGEDEKALLWIREAMRRNPESHEGTEWLHVRVLEAKLALKRDPRWLESHHVAGVEFGPGPLPAAPVSVPAPPGNLSLLREALEYQLHERLEFVRPPDPIVADLLFDLGNVLALTWTKEHAAAVYSKALEFSPADAMLVRQRARATEYNLEDFFRNQRPFIAGLTVGLVLAAALVSLSRFFRRRKSPA